MAASRICLSRAPRRRGPRAAPAGPGRAEAPAGAPTGTAIDGAGVAGEGARPRRRAGARRAAAPRKAASAGLADAVGVADADRQLEGGLARLGRLERAGRRLEGAPAGAEVVEERAERPGRGRVEGGGDALELGPLLRAIAPRRPGGEERDGEGGVPLVLGEVVVVVMGAVRVPDPPLRPGEAALPVGVRRGTRPRPPPARRRRGRPAARGAGSPPRRCRCRGPAT